MFINKFSKIFIILKLTNYLSFATAALDLNDIESIFNYFNGIEHNALNHYYLNVKLNDEINEIMNRIYNDQIKTLDELKSMSKNFEDVDYDREWNHIISFIESYGLKGKLKKNNIYQLSKLKENVNCINGRIDRMITAIDNLNEIRKSNVEHNFCSNIFPIAFIFLQSLSFESVFHKYRELVQIIRYEMESIINAKDKMDKRNFCGENKSFQYPIYNNFRQIMLTHIKLKALKYFNWITNKRCENNAFEYTYNYTNEIVYESRIIINETVSTMNSINYHVYNCDLSNPDENIELERMMQKIIINERNLSTTNSCDLQSINNMADRAGCRELRDCKYLSGRINVCESSDPVRRYQWLSLSDGIVYGNNDTCHGRISSIANDISSSSDSYQCFSFLCTCLIKPSQSPRVVTAISFRNQVSDISNNKVVVSIKFVKTISIIQVQIYEGTLQPFGGISLDQWKPLENISYDERGEKYYLTNNESWQLPLLLGVDYAYPEIMNFDDIVAPPGYVVTGVRFRYAGDLFIHPQFKSLPIQLQIRVTPFDFVGGKLVDIDETRWIAIESQNTSYEMPLENPDKPTKSPKNDPDSATNEFIKFRASDVGKDAGQTTVPFFDGQNVKILTRPMGGVGIFHRGCKGYGGYLAFKLFDVNLSKFLKYDL